MTNLQAYIIVIVIIIFTASYTIIIDSLGDKKNNWFIIICGTLCWLSFIFFVVFSIAAFVELQKQTKSICPEYEKIENVYILKKKK